MVFASDKEARRPELVLILVRAALERFAAAMGRWEAVSSLSGWSVPTQVDQTRRDCLVNQASRTIFLGGVARGGFVRK